MLRLDRFGRHALSDDEIRGSTLVGLVLLASLGSLVVALSFGDLVRKRLLVDTLHIGLLLIPVSAIYNCAAGAPRRNMALVAGGLTAFALLQLSLHWLTLANVEPAGRLAVKLLPLQEIYPWGILISSFAANSLSSRVVRR